MMYPLISIWTILPETRAEALAALTNLAVQVQSEEGTWIYTVHTPNLTELNLPTPAADQLVFFEVYENKDAFTAHVSGPIFTGFVQKYGHLFLNQDGSPYLTVEFMNRIAGFVKPIAVTGA
jgi:quinol monooxygenase YgiN